MPFRLNRDNEQHSFIDPFDNMKMCTGLMKWAVSKVLTEVILVSNMKLIRRQGESVFKDTHRCIPVYCRYNPGQPFTHATRLYACSLNQAQERYDDTSTLHGSFHR